MPSLRPTHVWYTAYGSNCSRDRFRVYLDGGRTLGSDDSHHGARDTAPPLADAPAELPTNICFAGHSRRWGGAPAFLEHHPTAATALGRSYLITMDQFEDVHAQENGRRPGAWQLPTAVADLSPGELLVVGDHAYDAIVGLEPVDGHPALTFTSPTPPEARPPAAPSEAYIATILHGLRSVHEHTATELVDQLLTAAGVDLGWDHDALMSVLDTPLGAIAEK